MINPRRNRGLTRLSNRGTSPPCGFGNWAFAALRNPEMKYVSINSENDNAIWKKNNAPKKIAYPRKKLFLKMVSSNDKNKTIADNSYGLID